MKLPILAPLLILTLAAPAIAETVAHWRFDEAAAADGAALTTAENIADPGTLDAQATGGSPLYSDDVPFAEIFDPVAGESYSNGYSFDASGSSAFMAAPDAAAFNSSFTVEFFIKLGGEPSSYGSFLRRRQAADLLWQVDFDHGANLQFGRIRTRWDTPAGPPDDMAERGVDENVNFVLGPLGGASAPKVFIDTGAKDEFGADVGPQNTGNVQDYVYDAASANPNETDVALQGDGINDVDGWHHVAMSFDETSGEIRFYFDYVLSQTRTLSDSEGDGYTHPAANLTFGKLSATENNLLIDEVRFSNAILSPGSFLREPSSGSEVIAHWRMDDEGAADGGEITTAANSASPLHSATRVNGTPTYSSDVPGTVILDPISATTYTNRLSFDASTSNSRIGPANDMAFDTSFTVEMFMKLVGEPGNYQPFVRRRQANDLRWQIDFDHGLRNPFGRMRCRFDTPAGEPDDMAVNGVDENVNIVAGAVGTLTENQLIYIDTDLGDGLVGSYDDPADWALDGDGLNDVPEWHHIALTFDEETGTIGFYYDYELMQMRTLSDSEGDGYTHPDGALQFGKFSSEAYGVLLDEVRYSGEVLQPFQFLQVAADPELPFAILEVSYDPSSNEATVIWPSEPEKIYAVERSFDLTGWFELTDDTPSAGETTSFTDTELPPDPPKVFYRVRDTEE